MRLYEKKKRLIKEIKIKESLDLSPLLPTRPNKVWNIATILRALADYNPTIFSENSKETWVVIVKKVNIQL
jgi:hypothetical protein